MPADAPSSPVAAPESAEPTAVSEESAQPAEQQPQEAPAFDMNAILRDPLGRFAQSKPEAGGDDADDADPVEESPASPESKPTATPEPGKPGTEPTRRTKAAQAQAELEAAKAEAARLKAELDAAPERIRQEIERQREIETAQSAKLSDVERYARLRDEPDENLSGEDYAWREQYKAKVRLFPEVEQHFKYEADKRASEAIAATVTPIKDGAAALISSMAAFPDIDVDKWRDPKTTWTDMANDLRAAGAALKAKLETLENDNSRLRKDAEDARHEQLANVRTPTPPGRPAGSNGVDMNALLRGLR